MFSSTLLLAPLHRSHHLIRGSATTGEAHQKIRYTRPTQLLSMIATTTQRTPSPQVQITLERARQIVLQHHVWRTKKRAKRTTGPKWSLASSCSHDFGYHDFSALSLIHALNVVYDLRCHSQRKGLLDDRRGGIHTAATAVAVPSEVTGED